jgi:hypothetical protein
MSGGNYLLHVTTFSTPVDQTVVAGTAGTDVAANLPGADW